MTSFNKSQLLVLLIILAFFTDMAEATVEGHYGRDTANLSALLIGAGTLAIGTSVGCPCMILFAGLMFFVPYIHSTPN